MSKPSAFIFTVVCLVTTVRSIYIDCDPNPEANTTGVGLNRTIVPFPQGVTGLFTASCIWTRDGSKIVCPFHTAQYGQQIGSIYPDGTGYQCITCNANYTGNNPEYLSALPDQKSIFSASKFSAPPGSTSHQYDVPQVAECSPSVLQCERVRILPVHGTFIPGALNSREPRISPDGRHYVWTIVRDDGTLMLMGDLEKQNSAYQVTNVRVLNAAPKPTTSRDWALRGAYSEGKSFFKGGTLVFASTMDQGGNYDDYSLDLMSGAIDRITYNLDWDESGSFHPSGNFLFLGSARNMHNNLRTFPSMYTPAFLDFNQLSLAMSADLLPGVDDLHVMESWLVTPNGEKSGCSGVMINNKTGGWSSGANKNPWNPRGDSAVWSEQNSNTSRLVVGQFSFPGCQETNAQPSCEDPTVDPSCQTPTPTWAPLLSDYPLLAHGNYTISGPCGGQAFLQYTGALLGSHNSIHYRDYQHCDGTILNGQTIYNGKLASGSQVAKSEIQLSGTRNGSGAFDMKLSSSGLICGTARSQIDGMWLVTHVGQWNAGCNSTVLPGMCPDGADSDATVIGQTGRINGTCIDDMNADKYLLA